MDATTVLSAIEAIAQLYSALAPLVGDVKTALASNDQAALDATLAKLQAANDALMAP